MIEMKFFFGKNPANHMALLPNQYLAPVTYGLPWLWVIPIQRQQKFVLGSEILQKLTIILLRILEKILLFVLYFVKITERF